MKKLIIIGAGGFGREVLAWARQSHAHGSEWIVRGFLDDRPAALQGFAIDIPVIGAIGDYIPANDEVFVCAMGNVALKRACIGRILDRGGVFTEVIHPTCVLGIGARLGRGVILCPHTILSSHATLGDFVSVNLHSSVAHDSVVGDYSQIHCHVDVTGNVQMGEEVTVGSHASILPGIRIGARALIGAGSLVTKDVAAGTTVFGVPARPYLLRNEPPA